MTDTQPLLLTESITHDFYVFIARDARPYFADPIGYLANHYKAPREAITPGGWIPSQDAFGFRIRYIEAVPSNLNLKRGRSSSARWSIA